MSRKLLIAAIVSASFAHAATTIWAGTEAGVFKSIDSGTTWQAVPVTTSNPLLQGTNPQTPNAAVIALDPQQPSTVLLGVPLRFPSRTAPPGF
jgi:hypothetical protein